MSTLYITEYSAVGVINGHVVPTPIEPGADQTVTVSGTSAASTAFATSTQLVRLHCDGICSVLFGTAPTATTAKRRMIAGQTEYFFVPPGAAYKVAAITNT